MALITLSRPAPAETVVIVTSSGAELVVDNAPVVAGSTTVAVFGTALGAGRSR